VIPAGFYEAHKTALAWNSGFDVVAFGTKYSGKKIDEDRRLNVRLRDALTSCELIRLAIDGRTLHVIKECE
jgi:hypothetical protein